MNQTVRYVVGIGLLVALARYGAAQDASFAVGFDCPDEVTGGSGDAVNVPCTGMLTTMGLNAGDPGAQGWSLSMTSDGCSIVDITIVGTAAEPSLSGGFQVTELTADALGTNPEAGCPDGSQGAVSAVVLNLVSGATLDPTGSPHDIFKITLEGETPDPEGCNTCTVFYVDNCEGSGEPVVNNVTRQGGSLSPELGSTDVLLCVEEIPPICPNPDLSPSVQLMMQTEVVDEAGFGLDGETSELFAGQADTPDPLLPAEVAASPGMVTVFAAIVSNGLENGVQGWSISGPVDESGGAMLVDVTIEGTAAGKALVGGFQVTELTKNASSNPDAGCPSPTGHGVVSAVVLDLVAGTTLQTTGTGSALALTFQGEDGQSALLSWANGCEGSGEPVDNVATISGGSEGFACLQSVVVSFAAPPVGQIIRCDANADGRVNIADAIWIVQELFYGGLRTACREASDCNDDGMTDLSDVVANLTYRFGGPDGMSVPPPAPGFPDCGLDPDSTEESCPKGSTSCP